MKLGLVRKREAWTLTWRGWVAAVVFGCAMVVVGFRSAFPFLAPTRPVPSEILAVEGWVPDDLVAEVRSEFEKGGYRLLVTTGGPIVKGEVFAEFKTYAEWTRDIFVKSGFDEKKVMAVPNAERFRDRTYASAVALRQWIDEKGQTVKSVNVFSRGAHARRTWLLFQMALGSQTKVGIIAGEEMRYNPERWWTTSQGVRDVLDEGIAFFYARFLFRPNH